jgi:hypothetical protein
MLVLLAAFAVGIAYAVVALLAARRKAPLLSRDPEDIAKISGTWWIIWPFLVPVLVGTALLDEGFGLVIAFLAGAALVFVPVAVYAAVVLRRR